MSDNIDDKIKELNVKMRNAIYNGTDRDVITVLEAYFTIDTRKEEIIFIGDRKLARQDIVREIREKTDIGMDYLFALKQYYLFQQTPSAA